MQNILEILQKKIDGLMYISESDYPVTPLNIDVSEEKEIPAFLASNKNADVEFVKRISSRGFFARFKNYLSYNGPDELLNENAKRFIELQQFFKQNFETTLVYRIEKPREAVVPIFIIGKINDAGFAGLETTAVET